MADFTITGFFDSSVQTNNSIVVTVSEFKNGYTRSDGVKVAEHTYVWKVIFPAYFKSYIIKHFRKGLLVQIKGEVFPYAKQKGVFTEGYSVFGQTINIATFPTNKRQETKLIERSQKNLAEMPDIVDFNADDLDLID